MVDDQFAKLAKENLLEVNVVAIANSTKMLFEEGGLRLKSSIERKNKEGEAMSMRGFFDKMVSLNLPNSVFVDCTSSADVTAFYEDILSANISIVTPNKKANSGSMENYEKLKATALNVVLSF